MNLSYQDHYLLFWVLLGVSILLLILAIFLFFYLDIPKVISDLSGRKQKKEIARLSDSQAVSDELDSSQLSQLERSLKTNSSALDSTSVRLDKKEAIRGEKAKVLDTSMQSDVFSSRKDSAVDISPLAQAGGQSEELADGSKYNPDLFEIINLNGDKDYSGELDKEIRVLEMNETEALSRGVQETEALSRAPETAALSNVNNFQMTTALNELNVPVETSVNQNNFVPNKSETMKLSEYDIVDNNSAAKVWVEVEEEINIGSSGRGVI